MARLDVNSNPNAQPPSSLLNHQPETMNAVTKQEMFSDFIKGDGADIHRLLQDHKGAVILT
jgi:hypothetical protein